MHNTVSLQLLTCYQLSWLYACLSALYIHVCIIGKIACIGLYTLSHVKESSLKQLPGSTFGKQAVINL